MWIIYLIMGSNEITIFLFFYFRIFLKKINVYLLLRDRETQSMSRGEVERWRDTESEAGSRLWASCQHRARCGAWTHEFWDHDLSRSWTLNWLSHPRAPPMKLFMQPTHIRITLPVVYDSKTCMLLIDINCWTLLLFSSSPKSSGYRLSIALCMCIFIT